MMLYLTRKFPPSIGGMQRFNEKLVAHLRPRRKFRLIKWGRSQALMPLFLAGAFFRALVLGLAGKIDSIYLSDALMAPMGWLLKNILRLPVAVNVHGRDIAFAFPCYLTVVPWALRRLDRVICVSRGLREVCSAYGVPEKILRVIPNGVDVSDFTWNGNTPPAEKLGIDTRGRTVLITVGRLVPKKGVDRFVRDILPELAAKEPGILYLVAGDGPLRGKIEAMIRELGLEKNARLLGDLPMEGEDLKAFYCLADIFVMPNVEVPGDIEGFGIVALEAGAAGKVVVASRLQGIREAVTEGENGILLDWDDTEAFRKTLLELIRDEPRRKELGLRAREFVAARYGWEKIAELYDRELGSLLEPQAEG